MAYDGMEPAGSILATRRRQRKLGRALRRLYDDALEEPVPADFLDILERINQRPAQGAKRGNPA
jgi:hypothetical protein